MVAMSPGDVCPDVVVVLVVVVVVLVNKKETI